MTLRPSTFQKMFPDELDALADGDFVYHLRMPRPRTAVWSVLKTPLVLIGLIAAAFALAWFSSPARASTPEELGSSYACQVKANKADILALSATNGLTVLPVGKERTDKLLARLNALPPVGVLTADDATILVEQTQVHMLLDEGDKVCITVEPFPKKQFVEIFGDLLPEVTSDDPGVGL